MNSITFTIEKKEVERVAGRKLSSRVVEKVLLIVENDSVLWDDIQKSITDAVKFIKEKG
ncbi:hypothetical protein IIA94_00200 [Patescibacteria group bacterium]|nr:hypothetical protein [Patescibacteria group bacterium]